MKKIFLLDETFEIPIDDSRIFEATLRELLDSEAFKSNGAFTICFFFEDAAKYFSEQKGKVVKDVLGEIFLEVIEEYGYETYEDIHNSLIEFGEFGDSLKLFVDTGVDTIGMHSPITSIEDLAQVLAEQDLGAGSDLEGTEDEGDDNPWSNFLDNLDLDGI